MLQQALSCNCFFLLESTAITSYIAVATTIPDIAIPNVFGVPACHRLHCTSAPHTHITFCDRLCTGIEMASIQMLAFFVLVSICVLFFWGGGGVQVRLLTMDR